MGFSDMKMESFALPTTFDVFWHNSSLPLGVMKFVTLFMLWGLKQYNIFLDRAQTLRRNLAYLEMWVRKREFDPKPIEACGMTIFP